jgi:hypothetical protein
VCVLNKGISRSNHGGAMLKQIWKLLEIDWLVEISHTYREVNKCTDVLANISCSLDYKAVFFDACPPQIRDIFTLIY